MVNPKMRRADFNDRQEYGFDSAVPSRWPVRYSSSLNRNPNLTGNITFAAGVEGSMVKALSSTTPKSGSYSQFRKFFVVTVVKDIPLAGSFRPCADGECVSKASIGNISQVDAAIYPSITLSNTPGLSVSNAKKQVEGPFMTEIGLGAVGTQGLYGREQTVDKSDPMYGPVFNVNFREVFARLYSSSTSSADKRIILGRIVQIGLVNMQNAATFTTPEYWPNHNSPYMTEMIDIAAAVCDSPAVRTAYSACLASDIYHEKRLKQNGNNPNQNGDTPGGPNAKTGTRFVDATDIYFRTPPEGGAVQSSPSSGAHQPIIADQEPGQTPYTGGFIGFPMRLGSGSPNSGQNVNLHSRYATHGISNTASSAMAAPIASATRSVASLMSAADAGVVDRYARYHIGHYAGDWNLKDANQFGSGFFQMWPASVTEAYQDTRSSWAGVHPVWLGRPEQPLPPLLSKPGSGQIRMNFLETRVSNNGPLTGAQYRMRRVKGSGASGTELRNLIFYNTSAWNSPVSMSASANSITVSGLSSGLWQIQWRLQNASGWSPWSTNVQRRGDGAAEDGWPAGPRAVILI
jgi:hypothetical protein